MMHPDQPAPAAGLTREQVRRWAAVQPEASGRILVGESPERTAVIAGLRALASYLAANPAVPVPPYGWEVLVHAEGTDSEQFSQVDLVGEMIGERPVDRRAATGHHHAERSFGPVTYKFVGISERRMAQHQALASYAGSVVPDEPAAETARLAAAAFPVGQAAVAAARGQSSVRRSPTGRRGAAPGLAGKARS